MMDTIQEAAEFVISSEARQAAENIVTDFAEQRDVKMSGSDILYLRNKIASALKACSLGDNERKFLLGEVERYRTKAGH